MVDNFQSPALTSRTALILTSESGMLAGVLMAKPGGSRNPKRFRELNPVSGIFG
jgi:hypothetical protein